jgi:two-component system invasion response regulator UvrY
MIKVVLADDHPFIRRGLRNILQKNSEIQVVGEAADGIQALRLVKEHQPDVLVLDMEMPGMRGIEVAERLLASGVDIPILALSAHEDRQYIVGMLASGAFGYLTKDEAPEMLVDAVIGAARGERGWVSRRAAARIALWMQNEKPEEFDLSRQEQGALQMMLAGKSPREIGDHLQMERREVEAYLNEITNTVRDSIDLLV